MKLAEKVISKANEAVDVNKLMDKAAKSGMTALDKVDKAVNSLKNLSKTGDIMQKSEADKFFAQFSKMYKDVEKLMKKVK